MTPDDPVDKPYVYREKWTKVWRAVNDHGHCRHRTWEMAVHCALNAEKECLNLDA